MSLRCNCPQYNVPSADPNDSRGCPVHDPDYIDPQVKIRELESALTFSRLREQNLSRVQRWHPGFPKEYGDSDGWTGGDWGNAMAGEAGEACNIIKKLRRAEEGFKGVLDKPSDGLKEALALELADLVTYADLVAAFYGIDLGEAVARKFNAVSELQGFPERL